MTSMTETMSAPASEIEQEPSRKQRRKAAKQAARLERKLEKAKKKAWKKARPRKQPWVAPILWVNDVRGHAHWLERAFGFEIERIMDAADGSAQHAIVRHRRGVVMLGHSKDATLGPPSGKACSTQYVYTADVDELALRATAAGATLVNPPRDEPWGDRCVPLTDPEGHSWMFATHVGCVTGDDAQGSSASSSIESRKT